MKWITLYRGLGLPEDAIQTYRELLKAKGDDRKFGFTAFTSTSINKKIALEYALLASKNGQIPVLFILKAIDYGRNKTFLYDKEFSAHPEEQEYLLGSNLWHVTGIREETVDVRGNPLELTVIELRNVRSSKL